jgi:hypothetical protein
MPLKDINQVKAEAELAEICRQPKVDRALCNFWDRIRRQADETGLAPSEIAEAAIAENPKLATTFRLLGFWLRLDDDGSLHPPRDSGLGMG